MNLTNFTFMEAYLQKTFLHLGKTSEEKEHITVLVKTLTDDLEAVLTDPSLCTNGKWVKGRCRMLQKLDIIRSAHMNSSSPRCNAPTTMRTAQRGRWKFTRKLPRG